MTKSAATGSDSAAAEPVDRPARRPEVASEDASSLPPAPRLQRAKKILAFGLVFATAAVATFLALNFGSDTDDQVDNYAFVDKDKTAEVKEATARDVEQLVSIDYQQLDEYEASVGDILTPPLVDELMTNWAVLKQNYQDTKTVVSSSVSDVGVTFLDGDHAEVLLVQSVSIKQDDVESASATGPYRLKVAKVDGVWKLAEIPDLAAN